MLSQYQTLITYSVSGGLNLTTNLSSLWAHLFGAQTPFPLNLQELSHTPLYCIDDDAFYLLDKHIIKAYRSILKKSNSEDKMALKAKFRAYKDLESLHQDIVDKKQFWESECKRNWKAAKIEDVLGQDLSHATKAALSTPQSCLSAGREALAKASQVNGESIFQGYVALPLVKLATDTLDSVKRLRWELTSNTTSKTVPDGMKPDVLIKGKNANILCCEVKASSGDMGKAWEESVGSCLCLTPQTHYSTVVMAVAGNSVRIGLLTLLPSGQENITNSSLRLLNGDLEESLTRRLKGVNVGILDNEIYKGLKLHYIVEFNVEDITSDKFDVVMSDYFRYIMKPIRHGLRKNVRITYLKDGRVARCQTKDASLRFPGCPGDFIVKALRVSNPVAFSKAHNVTSYVFYRHGTFPITSTDKFYGTGDFNVCIYKHLEGERIQHRKYGTFAKACALVVYLHKNGFCHGDLRSPNILSEARGDDLPIIRLIDFEYMTENSDRIPDANTKTKVAFNEFLATCEAPLSASIMENSLLYRRLLDIYSLFHFVWYWTEQLSNTLIGGSGSKRVSRSKSASGSPISQRNKTIVISGHVDEKKLKQFHEVFRHTLEHEVDHNTPTEHILCALFHFLSDDYDLSVELGIIMKTKLFQLAIPYDELCAVSFVINLESFAEVREIAKEQIERTRNTFRLTQSEELVYSEEYDEADEATVKLSGRKRQHIQDLLKESDPKKRQKK